MSLRTISDLLITNSIDIGKVGLSASLVPFCLGELEIGLVFCPLFPTQFFRVVGQKVGQTLIPTERQISIRKGRMMKRSVRMGGDYNLQYNGNSNLRVRQVVRRHPQATQQLRCNTKKKDFLSLCGDGEQP